MIRIVLVILSWICTIDALTCYYCQPTYGRTEEEANIECLATSWEQSCAENQDRCYSRLYPKTLRVEKGCAESTQCVQTTSCCQTSYCNADAQTSQTGYGRPCNDVTDCIQGGREMICAREMVTDYSKVCLCADDSYQRGFTCKRKSYPNDPCQETRHCYDDRSTCDNGYCACPEGMFGNGSFCENQNGLGGYCKSRNACRGRFNTCLDERCTCEFGYLVINGTDHCSGCSGISALFPPPLLFVVSIVLAR